MASPTKPRSPFGDLLRQELGLAEVSIRELARRLTTEELQFDSARRLLAKYLRGEVTPGLEMRERIAEVLGINPVVFAEDAEHTHRLGRVLDALGPLADALLEITVEVARKDGKP